MANRFNIIDKRAALERVMLTAPSTVGDLAVNFFKARFRAGGWYDYGFEQWKARSQKAKRNKGRALLVNSGRLRRSIRISKLTANSVTIGTDVPYAAAHNSGANGTVNVRAHNRRKFARNKVGTGKLTKTGKERTKTMTSVSGVTAVRQHTRKMNLPKRQFMGESRYLNKLIERKLTTMIKTALQ